MRLELEHMVKVVKVKDLHAFAQSLVEIMVGRSEFSSVAPSLQQKDKKNNRNQLNPTSVQSTFRNSIGISARYQIHGSIPMDMIPLNWSKIPEIQKIFQILSLCLGPYDHLDSLNVDSAKIFKEVVEISSQALKEWQQLPREEIHLLQREQQLSRVQVSRLQSAVMNNKGVMKYLNISQQDQGERLNILLREIKEDFKLAIYLSPQNPIAILNYFLLKWSIAEITDEQFLQVLKLHISKLDRKAYRLMWILFKKLIKGSSILEQEIRETVKSLDSSSHSSSNLAKLLMSHPEFLRYREHSSKEGARMAHHQLKFIKNQFYDEGRPYYNFTFAFDSKFGPQSIHFSSNDSYIAVIGIQSLVLINNRTGNKVLEQKLPDHREQESALDNPDAAALVSQDQPNDDVSSLVFTPPLDPNDGPESVCSETSLTSPSALQIKKKGILSVQQEKELLIKKYPPEWIASIGNNGKQLALYDKSQLKRNKEAKYIENIQESLYVYTVTLAKSSLYEPNEYELDMLKMLNNEEVLSFGLDDYISDQFGLVCVQAKDLCMYIIDFEKKQVVHKADSKMTSVVMQSVFFSMVHKDENLQFYDRVKQFVEEQESIGNQVRMPKCNEEIIAVMVKSTNLIKLYNIRTNRFVRMFYLSLQEEESDDIQEIDSYEGSSDGPSDVYQEGFQSGDLIGRAMAEEEQKMKDVIQLMNVQKSEGSDGEIKFFDISPKGFVLGAIIGRLLFIKVLNQVEREQFHNSLGYHQSIAFMPIYFDEDYAFQSNRNKKLTKDTQCSLSEMQKMELLTPKSVDHHLRMFHHAEKFQGTEIAKLQKTYEILDFFNLLMSNPRHIIQASLGSKKRMEVVQHCFNLVRFYQLQDVSAIKLADIKDIRAFTSFDSFHFSRSFETIKDIWCSQQGQRSLMVASINRRIHVCDLIKREQIFQVELPGLSERRVGQSPILFMTDGDKLIVVQESDYRLVFINVQNQMERQVKKQTVHHTEDQVVKMENREANELIEMGMWMSFQNKMNFTHREMVDKAEDSDVMGEEEAGVKLFDLNSKITSIFFTRATSQYSYLAVIGESRITVLFVYEESSRGCEVDTLWDIDYKYDSQLGRYGQHTCLDFYDNGSGFISGTRLGYICKWELKHKKMVKYWSIKNQEEIGYCISLVRNIKEDSAVIYSAMGQNLNLVEFSQSPIVHKTSDKNRKGKKVEFDSLRGSLFTNRQVVVNTRLNGQITDLKVDPSAQLILICYQSGVIQLVSVASAQTIKHIDVVTDLLTSVDQDASIINSSGFTPSLDQRNPSRLNSKFFIDDQCTYVAVVGENLKKVELKIFEREFSLKVVEKPVTHVIKVKKQEDTTETFQTDQSYELDNQKNKKILLSPIGRISRVIKRRLSILIKSPSSPVEKKEQKSQTCSLF